MSNPFFSIIVPVYNVEKYLNKCLDSILNESFKDYELIIINDGTTDSSGIICEEYAITDSRIKLIHKQNGGLSSARNVGISVAKGKFVWFIDSDDYVLPNSLTTLYNHLLKEKVDVLCFSNHVFFEKNNTIEKNNLFKETKVLSNIEFLKVNDLVIAPWIYVFNINFLKINTISFREDVKIYEDGFYLYEVFSKLKKVKCITDHLYVYRIRENSLTTSTKRNFDKINAFAKSALMLNDYREKYLYKSFWDEKIYETILNFYNIYFELREEEKNLFGDIFKNIRKINMHILQKDAFGVKIMKLTHNLFFLFFKYKLMNTNEVK